MALVSGLGILEFSLFQITYREILILHLLAQVYGFFISSPKGTFVADKSTFSTRNILERLIAKAKMMLTQVLFQACHLFY